MTTDSAKLELQQAVLDFTLGDYTVALEKLDHVIFNDPGCFDAHLAKTEVLYAMEQYEQALSCAEKAEKIESDDIHLKTSLSRIWMRLGNKEKAEAYAAEAKMLNWKQELLSGNKPDPSSN